MTKRLVPKCLNIKTVDDIVNIRREVRAVAEQLDFGLSDQTRVATAVSELSRNCLQYAGSGIAKISDLSSSNRKVLQLIIFDNGPGISDISKAMSDGYTTSKGLGMGLPGCRRLMDSFRIESTVGQGTKVWIEIYENR